MMKLKQFLALVLLVFSTCLYAQLLTPTLIGTPQKYSAKGSGVTGIPTIDYPLPAGKNRIIILSMLIERDRTTTNPNILDSNGDTTSIPDIYINGIKNDMFGVSYNTGVTYQMSTGGMVSLFVPDSWSGTIPITIPAMTIPNSTNDEMSVMVLTYENVAGFVDERFNSLSTNLTINNNTSWVENKNGTRYQWNNPTTIPVGRNINDFIFLAGGYISTENLLSLSSGWTSIGNIVVANTPGTTKPNVQGEYTGISQIVGSLKPTNNTIPTSTINSVPQFSASHYDAHLITALLPLASPSVTGKVVTPTLNSATGTHGGSLWMNVVDKADNKIVAVVAIDASGNFTIPQGTLIETYNYDFILSKNKGVVGSTNPITVELNTGWGTVAEGINSSTSDGTSNSIINLTVGFVNISGLRFAIQNVVPSLQNLTISCPNTSVNLNSAHSNVIPSGFSLVWFTNNTHSGTALSGTGVTQAGEGTYYAFYYDNVNNFYSPASNPVVVTNLTKLDSDGDGIPDACDLDDDNDGILDVNEGVCNQKAIYTLDAIATAAGATINPLGGSFNLIYKLKEGTTPVASLGNQFTIPFSYSKMSYGTNVWEGINDLGPDALSIRPNTNSLYSNLPANNTTMELTTKIYPEEVFTELISNNKIDLLGTYSATIGNIPALSSTDTAILSNAKMTLHSAWNMIGSGTTYDNGYYSKITTQNQIVDYGNFAESEYLEVDYGKTYVYDYTAFTNKIGSGAGNQGDRGFIQIRFAEIEFCIPLDTDGDGIPDYLDLDSDNDGCPDAIEGSANFTTSQLTNASGIVSSQLVNQNFGITVDTNGIPTTVGASGQGVGNSQNEMVNDCISFICPPDPYAAQQTWWLPYYDEKVRIDFQSGLAVLNNPATGFLGKGVDGGFEGNVAVTHPVTGELLFVTDGNVVYKGSTGEKASGLNVGGHPSAGEAAAVIPDPQGILGMDFLIIGNSTYGTPGGLYMSRYNVATNSLTSLTNLLGEGSINEGLEVIPHSNGEDYWVLVNTSDQKLKSFLFSKTTGFNPSAISSTDVSDLPGVDPNSVATNSHISWDPNSPGKILVSRHNKIGLVNFNPFTGTIGEWNVKIMVTTGNADNDSNIGYSAALSSNGQYIYYVAESNNLMAYNLQTSSSMQVGTIPYLTGIKLGPDGKLYGVGYSPDWELRLFYYNTPNSPTFSTTTLPIFNTDGREISLQLPNNVYWGCMTCQSGNDAPILANTNITTNPTTIGNLIALLSASNLPVGTVITIHSDAIATDANRLSNSTAIVAGTTYYVSFYDGLAICYSPTTSIKVGEEFCYQPGLTDSNNYPSKHGITSLGRAGSDIDNWPMVRQSAWTVLESKTKGFVINRVQFNSNNEPVATDGTSLVITSPVEGMMVYDTTNNCLKVYTSKDAGNTYAWYCMTTQTCPE